MERSQTVDEAVKAYSERFGGFPWFLFMGADGDLIIEAVERSLETGRGIEPEDGVIY